MQSVNELVLSILRKLLPEVDSVNELNRWWASEGTPDEDILDFLIRQGVLHPDSRKTLPLAQRGLLESSSDMLLLVASREEIIEKLRRAPDPEHPPTIEAIETIEPVAPTPLEESSGSGPVGVADDPTQVPEVRGEIRVDLQSSPPLRSSSPSPTDKKRKRKEILPPGTKLGKCMLLGVIGQGSNGTVYRAFHQSLRISVAVKVVRTREGSDEAAFRQRILEEGRMLAKLNHPNIVRVWDIEEDPVQPWLVLELIDGISLQDLIEQSGRVGALQAVRIVREMTLALEAAWEIGIVHRDVKPANILIPNAGPARLTDLGLARIVTVDLNDLRQVGPGGTPAGTAAYMSPEQAYSALAADYRSDMYSLGATFYHMLTGELPFVATTWMEMVKKHATQVPTPPHQKVSELSPMFEALIGRMMAKRPQDRYQTFGEQLADLGQVEAVLHRGSDENRPQGAQGSYFDRYFRR